MKRMLVILVLLSMLLTLLPLSAAAHTADDPYTVDLIAGQDFDNPAGVVKVWNDENFLYVKYEVYQDPGNAWCLNQTHLAVGDSLDDIPVNNKGNPQIGQFPYGNTYDCASEDTFQIPLTLAVGTELFIAAHAVVNNIDPGTGVEETILIQSGVDTATVTHRRPGPGTGRYECVDPATENPSYPWGWDDPAGDVSFPAVAAWEAFSGDVDPSTWDNLVKYQAWLSGTDWIWESYRVADPVCGTAIRMETPFELPNALLQPGTLRVACDNAYEAFVNNAYIGKNPAAKAGWRDSDYTESFVNTNGWRDVGIYALNNLQWGPNVLKVEAANEYMDEQDLYNNALGTIDINPGGCIWELEAPYIVPGDDQTAWGEGTGFPTSGGGSWAMYFTYTVQ